LQGRTTRYYPGSLMLASQHRNPLVLLYVVKTRLPIYFNNPSSAQNVENSQIVRGRHDLLRIILGE
ncbi:MAG: hypothetical protein ACJ795_00300, partial [Ktedonobacteraceae bacterium]